MDKGVRFKRTRQPVDYRSRVRKEPTWLSFKLIEAVKATAKTGQAVMIEWEEAHGESPNSFRQTIRSYFMRNFNMHVRSSVKGRKIYVWRDE